LQVTEEFCVEQTHAKTVWALFVYHLYLRAQNCTQRTALDIFMYVHAQI